MVHLDSLKDTRLCAPFDELRLGAGQHWPTAHIIPIRATNKTSLADVAGRYCLCAGRSLKYFFSERTASAQSCARLVR